MAGAEGLIALAHDPAPMLAGRAVVLLQLRAQAHLPARHAQPLRWGAVRRNYMTLQVAHYMQASMQHSKSMAWLVGAALLAKPSCSLFKAVAEMTGAQSDMRKRMLPELSGPGEPVFLQQAAAMTSEFDIG